MSRRTTALVLAGGALLAVLVWTASYRGSVDTGLGDLPVYQHAARLMALGGLPYRDFAVEYPPAAAGLFGLAAALPGSYAAAFAALMLTCALVAMAGAVATARALSMPAWRAGLAAAVIAVSPYHVGNLTLTRYDMAVTAILAWLAFCAVTGRWRWVWALMGAAVLMKLVPLVLVPVLLVAQLHRAPVARTIRTMLPGGALAAGGLLPFAIIAPHGLWQSVAYHLDRPLQTESLAAAGLLVAHQVVGLDLRQVRSYGSDNLAGSLPDALATFSGLLGAVLVVLVALHLRRRLATAPNAARPALVLQALAATMAALVATGKVLSPQYLLWLLPLVPLLPRWRGPAASALLLGALYLSGQIFPVRYRELIEDLAAEPTWLLAARDVLLVLVVAVAWPRSDMAHKGNAHATDDEPDRQAPRRIVREL